MKFLRSYVQSVPESEVYGSRQKHASILEATGPLDVLHPLDLTTAVGSDMI